MNTEFKDPFSDLESMFKRFMEHVQSMSRLPSSVFSMRQFPNINLSERDTQFILLAEVAGCNPEAVKISIEDNRLIIQGERNPQQEAQGTRCHYLEIQFGAFYREIQLPMPVKADQIKAEFRNGMLTVLLPKKAPGGEARTVTIEVKE